LHWNLFLTLSFTFHPNIVIEMSTPNETLARMASNSSAKADLNDKEHHETSAGTSDGIPKPESIRHMTDEELLRLKTKMVRKLDMIIMYVCYWVYISSVLKPRLLTEQPQANHGYLVYSQL
jgi:hypothetical protein